MATATELTINTAATAMDMANTIFGPGITVSSATFSGDAASSGIYSGALTAMPGVSPTDTGVILSTGSTTAFTNPGSFVGDTNTNTLTGAGSDVLGGINGDAQLNAVAGMDTFDGAILTATFTPDGDYLTMQFVFTSDEYPEYVLGGVNDAFGVWVNGTFVPVSITVAGNVAIDEVNSGKNENLYRDNTADQLNIEMDGLTYTLSLKAAVLKGQPNTIKIGIADGGDAIYDSNLLIMADSVQTVTLAVDDTLNVVANSSRTFDILANDTQTGSAPLTITQINGTAVSVGQTVTLTSGQQVRLNADGTVTVFANGVLGQENLSYTVSDGTQTDIGYIHINTTSAVTKDGIVSGTSAADSIDTAYTGDPDGDRVDNNDATGVLGTTGNADVIYAGAGNDSVAAGAGNDIVDADSGDDTVFGDAGDDSLYGDDGRDQLAGDAGADLIYGGADADIITGAAGDIVFGGETATAGGSDADTLVLANVQSLAYGGGNNEAGSVTFTDGSTLTFSEIETLVLNGGNRDGIIFGTAGNDSIGAGYVDANGDVIDNNDAILSNPGSNDDEVYAGNGDDTVKGLLGNDYLYGGEGHDSLDGGTGNDYMQGDAGNDTVVAGEGNDFIRGDAGNDSVYGGLGDDSTYGGLGEDRVFAGDGNDEAYGGYGNDVVYGGAGDDNVTGSGQDDVVYGDDGNDIVHGSDGDDTLYGGAGADTLLGEDDADLIHGGAGDYVDGFENVTVGTDNDTLNVTDVASVIFDAYNPENGVVTFNGGGTLHFYNIEHVIADGTEIFAPDFIVEGTGGDDLIDAAYAGDPEGDRIDAGDNLLGNNDDHVLAGDGDDTVLAGAGADLVLGSTGNDSLDGGTGNDSLFGGSGNDFVAAGDNADLIDGGAGDDTLDGALGNDTLTGGDGNDSLLGGDDRDYFYVGAGDVVDGGEGGDDYDTLDLAAFGHAATHVIYDTMNPENGTIEFLDAFGVVVDTMTFTNIEKVVACFTPGAMILTDRGEVAVEDLVEGDAVLTRDDGFQPLRWIGRRDLTGADLKAEARFAPVQIAKGALGLNLPERDMKVSPQHRMLMTGPRAELLFGEHEVLVAAIHMVGMAGVTRVQPADGVSYLHVLFDQHEIVWADGTWSESFQPGIQTMNGLDSAQRGEILALFPQLATGMTYPAARLKLKAQEAQVLLRT